MPRAAPQTWTRDELRLTCALYFELPFGRMSKGSPEVIALAERLGRTPNSVAMKLVQFASLDRYHQQRGVRGLQNTSQADRAVWEEFQGDCVGTIAELELPQGEGRDEWRLQKARVEQGAFRRVVLAAYDFKCCVTGNPVSELLVASHILPWAEYPEQRLNPRNGLCLSAEFDRAFDRKLIGVDEEFRLRITRELRLKAKGSEYLQEHFVRREGIKIRMPERFAPDVKALRIHARGQEWQQTTT